MGGAFDVDLDETVSAPVCACDKCARRAETVHQLTIAGVVSVTTRFSLEDARKGCLTPWSAVVRAPQRPAAIASGMTEEDAVLEAFSRIA